MTTGARIAQKRKELNLTQEELGEQLGVSRQSVYRWEQGATIPEIAKLVAMSRLFGVTVGWLLGEEEAESPAEEKQMTPEQLRLVQEITDRYVAAHRSRKKTWVWAALAVVTVAMLAVIVAVMASCFRQIAALNDRFEALESLVSLMGQEESSEPDYAMDPGQLTAEYLPVVYINGESMTDWGGKDDVREAVLTYAGPEGGSFSMEITVRPQGSSSLGYEKKNFTIEVLDGGVEMMPGWGEQTEFCLKANYIDPTHAGNVVSARLAGQMNQAYGVLSDAPNGGSIDGFPIWLVLNDESAGLYTWNIPKSAWMFGMDETDENHIVMCGEGPLDGCLFLSESYIVDTEWTVEVAADEAAALEKFDRLYQFINQSTEEEFRENFDRYLDLDACLNYYCFMIVSHAADNTSNNLLMVTYDGEIWAPALYDLDSLWGINWDGLTTVEDSAVDTLYNDSALWGKLLDCFGDELRARYAELRGDILSEDNIWSCFEEFISAIPPAYYEYDTQMWNPDGTFIRTLELMKACVAGYLPEIDAEMQYIVP